MVTTIELINAMVPSRPGKPALLQSTNFFEIFFRSMRRRTLRYVDSTSVTHCSTPPIVLRSRAIHQYTTESESAQGPQPLQMLSD